MPTYEYECAACGEVSEIFQSITAPPKRKCPVCGKLRLKRLIGGGAGFIFKGSGFYTTDYRSAEYKEKAKAESGQAKESSSADSSKSSKSGGGGSGSGKSVATSGG
ncbi:MAG: zinc ribbon domain-containing protein [Planctomycetes bacterium]|nr:zinc ribbon domain-containing protein [Planctomycetota bacterium]